MLLKTTRPCPVLDFLTAELAVDTLSTFMLPTPLNPFCYSFTWFLSSFWGFRILKLRLVSVLSAFAPCTAETGCHSVRHLLKWQHCWPLLLAVSKGNSLSSWYKIFSTQHSGESVRQVPGSPQQTHPSVPFNPFLFLDFLLYPVTCNPFIWPLILKYPVFGLCSQYYASCVALSYCCVLMQLKCIFFILHAAAVS